MSTKSYEIFEHLNLFTCDDINMDSNEDVQFTKEGSNLIYKSILDGRYNILLLANYLQRFQPEVNVCSSVDKNNIDCVRPASLENCPPFQGTANP